MSSIRSDDNISRDLQVLEDESNPRGSRKQTVYPSTTLDQVFDQERIDRKTLREILADLRQEIITGGKGNIVFPVTSVNGKEGDVTIGAQDVGLGHVDNTADAEKPLSDPQRESIQKILSEYDFSIHLEDLKKHLLDTNNPHNVGIDDLDRDGALSRMIQDLLNKHNYSTNENIHRDIRRSLSDLWTIVDQANDGLDETLEQIQNLLNQHIADNLAHQNLMQLKEDLSNKASSFDDTFNDHTKYPTTRAVAEYMATKIREFADTLPDVEHWIDDIQVVNTRTDLPTATARYYRQAYFIRQGISSRSEIAICRFDAATTTYYWDYSELGGYSKFNPNQFQDSTEGLSINTAALMDSIMNQAGVLEKTLQEVLTGYYTKDEINASNFVGGLHIVSGTMDGCIRFYVNDDPRTMSSDVEVAGLKRLAYLEWITEEQIWDQAIHERHILSRAIVNRHIKERAVTNEKILCPPGYVIANIDDTTNTAQLVPFDQLRTSIGAGTDDRELTEEEVRSIWDTTSID